MHKRLRLNVTGRVQGVFFRYSAKKAAEILSLKGYAKNLSDGSVEIVAEGPEVKLKSLLHWCNSGPKHAEIANISVLWQKPRYEFEDFHIQ